MFANGNHWAREVTSSGNSCPAPRIRCELSASRDSGQSVQAPTASESRYSVAVSSKLPTDGRRHVHQPELHAPVVDPSSYAISRHAAPSINVTASRSKMTSPPADLPRSRHPSPGSPRRRIGGRDGDGGAVRPLEHD